MEQREVRKRDEVVREREIEHMGVRGRLGRIYMNVMLDY